MIYFILYLYFFYLSVIQLIYKQAFKIITIFSMLLLIFLAGIRVNTGIDYLAYLDIWKAISPISRTSTFQMIAVEPGFVFLVSFIKLFTAKSLYFFLVCAFLSIFPVYLGLKKMDIKYMFISFFIYLLVFYLTYPFNGMRQGIAMGIFIFSLPFIFKKKLFYVILLSTVAGLVHLTGFLIIIAYLVTIYKINIKQFFLVGFLLSMVCLKLDLLGKLLFDVLGVSNVYMTLFSESTSMFQITTRVLLSFVLYYFGKMIKNPVFDKLFIMYLVGFFIYISLFQYNLLATRFNMFFRLLEIILVPMLLEKTKNVETRLTLLFIFLIPSTYSFYTFLLVEENKYHYELNF
ncbi:EpsG family protein [Capnocytophaga felis]|uniref:EpsG family protein n=1 Tax=Capnocytophaga felis TaxID=2267611 RepID=UPI0012D31C84|nr:EpsG family protein [Capnocytophaga felis]